ncbi:MAG: hypothetical protein ACP5R2_03995, partial [Anaerolineae bacterium]
YNVLRPHTGVGMDNRSPLTVLQRLGYTGNEQIALFPPVLLDDISTDLLLSCRPETGNDLLAHYILPRTSPKISAFAQAIAWFPIPL